MQHRVVAVATDESVTAANELLAAPSAGHVTAEVRERGEQVGRDGGMAVGVDPHLTDQVHERGVVTRCAQRPDLDGALLDGVLHDGDDTLVATVAYRPRLAARELIGARALAAQL